MSKTAYGRIFYGYLLSHQVSKTANGTVFECFSNSNHEVVSGKSYCPSCGSHVKLVPKMDYSEVLREYALKHHISLDEAYGEFSKYEHKAPLKYNDREKDQNWVFGGLIAEGGTNSCGAFNLIDLDALTAFFKELKLDPEKASYYLMVELD
jgi:hypothetical protein